MYHTILDEYNQLWDNLDKGVRKKTFIDLYCSKIGTVKGSIKKVILIEQLAQYDYNKLKEEQEIYTPALTQEYSKTSFVLNKESVVVSIPDIWVEVASNCHCVPDHHNEYSSLSNGVFKVQVNKLYNTRDTQTKNHLNKHLKYYSRLSMHTNYTIPEQEATDINVQTRSKVYNTTVHWMNMIECAVVDNINLIHIIRKPTNSIHIPSLNLHYNTQTNNIDQHVVCPVRTVNYTGGFHIGGINELIGLIASRPCTLDMFNHPQYSRATLVFTEQHLINQWKIQNKEIISPRLNIMTISSFNDIQYISTQEIKNTDIVLVSYNMLLDKRFNKFILKKFTWYRIVIHEIMEILNNKYPYKIFQFIKELDRMYNWANSSTVIEDINHYTDIVEFLRLKINIVKQMCIDNKYITNTIDTFILQQLFERLGYNTKKSIVSSADYIFSEMTEKNKNHYNYIYRLYRSETNKNVRRLACDIYPEKLNRCQLKDIDKLLKISPVHIDTVIQHINENKDNSCSICLEKITNLSILNVCGHVFCTECINTIVSHSSKCPLCRRTISSKNIIDINDTEPTVTQKMAKCIEYIQNNSTKENKFIIHCDWEDNLVYVMDTLNKHNIPTLYFTGGINKQNKLLNEFKHSAINIMCISKKHKLTGLDLSFVNKVLLLNPTSMYASFDRVSFITKFTVEMQHIK